MDFFENKNQPTVKMFIRQIQKFTEQDYDELFERGLTDKIIETLKPLENMTEQQSRLYHYILARDKMKRPQNLKFTIAVPKVSCQIEFPKKLTADFLINCVKLVRPIFIDPNVLSYACRVFIIEVLKERFFLCDYMSIIRKKYITISEFMYPSLYCFHSAWELLHHCSISDRPKCYVIIGEIVCREFRICPETTSIPIHPKLCIDQSLATFISICIDILDNIASRPNNVYRISFTDKIKYDDDMITIGLEPNYAISHLIRSIRNTLTNPEFNEKRLLGMISSLTKCYE